MNASEPLPPGLAKLAEHCARASADELEHVPATLRLRQAIGEELARKLLTALAGDHRRARLCGTRL
jgi:hypothetical protein